MSLVTNVVVWAGPLATEPEDPDPADVALRDWLVQTFAEDWFGQHLIEVADEAMCGGGHKGSPGSVFTACFNYVSSGSVIAMLDAAPWAESHRAVAIIDYEHDDRPIVWRRDWPDA